MAKDNLPANGDPTALPSDTFLPPSGELPGAIGYRGEPSVLSDMTPVWEIVGPEIPSGAGNKPYEKGTRPASIVSRAFPHLESQMQAIIVRAIIGCPVGLEELKSIIACGRHLNAIAEVVLKIAPQLDHQKSIHTVVRAIGGELVLVDRQHREIVERGRALYEAELAARESNESAAARAAETVERPEVSVIAEPIARQGDEEDEFGSGGMRPLAAVVHKSPRIDLLPKRVRSVSRNRLWQKFLRLFSSTRTRSIIGLEAPGPWLARLLDAAYIFLLLITVALAFNGFSHLLIGWAKIGVVGIAIAAVALSYGLKMAMFWRREPLKNELAIAIAVSTIPLLFVAFGLFVNFGEHEQVNDQRTKIVESVQSFIGNARSDLSTKINLVEADRKAQHDEVETNVQALKMRLDEQVREAQEVYDLERLGFSTPDTTGLPGIGYMSTERAAQLRRATAERDRQMADTKTWRETRDQAIDAEADTAKAPFVLTRSILDEIGESYPNQPALLERLTTASSREELQRLVTDLTDRLQRVSAQISDETLVVPELRVEIKVGWNMFTEALGVGNPTAWLTIAVALLFVMLDIIVVKFLPPPGGQN